MGEFTLDEVQLEQNRQIELWGEQSHDRGMWYAILGEEFGEVGKAINEHDGDHELVEELIQVAAVAASWVDDILGRERTSADMSEDLFAYDAEDDPGPFGDQGP